MEPTTPQLQLVEVHHQVLKVQVGNHLTVLILEVPVVAQAVAQAAVQVVVQAVAQVVNNYPGLMHKVSQMELLIKQDAMLEV